MFVVLSGVARRNSLCVKAPQSSGGTLSIIPALLTQLLSLTEINCIIFTACYTRSCSITVFPSWFLSSINTRKAQSNGLAMLTGYIILQSQMKWCKYLMSEQTNVTFRCSGCLLTFACTLNMLQFIWEF